jgi:hypothetical protein
METLPSLEALAAMFSCELRRGDEHPEYGLLEYEVEFDSDHERVSLKVLPLAEEVSVNVFTRNPSRIIQLSLEDVSKLIVVEEEDGGKAVEIRFHNGEVQPLSLRLRPIMTLFWGNFHDSSERHPPWERDDA